MDWPKNVAIAVLVAASIAGCGSNAEPVRVADGPKVLPGAVVAMRPDQWPDTYRDLGADAFHRANRIQPAMAELLARRSECDQLTYLGISGQSTRSELRFFGDCKNGRRVTGSERELQS